MPRVARIQMVAFTVALCVGGCHAILGLDDPTVEDPRPTDGGDGDVVVLGPSTDGGNPTDGNVDGDATPTPPNNFIPDFHVDWDQPTYWNKVNLKSLNVGTTTFVGAVFDGKYIYFAPSNNTNDPTFAARYDTTAGGLTVTAAWQFFDTSLLNADARGFEGAFFDGRYVHLVPYFGANGHVGRFARFDTKAQRDFNDPVAWSHFDTTSLNEYAKGFMGGVFDGRFSYVVTGVGTFATGDRPQAVAARLDSQNADWKSPDAWQFFDTQTITDTDAGGPRGFCGAVDTGSHIYFVPYAYAGIQRGRAVRYDRAKPFASPTSWEAFDLQNVHPNSVGFQGGAFDGRYVYYTPTLRPGASNGTITRFDTTKPFTNAGSWAAFDLESLDGGVPASQSADAAVTRGGYVGAGFDGRFIYLTPYLYGGLLSGWLARFDTTKPELSDPSAWSFYDLSRVDPQGKGMCGAVFDAKYMYFVPCYSSTVIRFDALDPIEGDPVLPKLPRNGSFL